MSKPIVIHWFRRDLRLADNPALNAAVDHAREADATLLCLYIHDEHTAGDWAWGGAHRWWLDKSLKSLGDTLSERGNKLVLRAGEAQAVLEELLDAHDIVGVYWNRCYEAFAIKRDKAIKDHIKERGITVESFNGSLLNEPWTIETKTGGPYKVFTPYWRAMLGKGGIHEPSNAHKSLPPAPRLNSENQTDWGLHPHEPDWSHGLAKRWTPGEEYARDRLRRFLDGKIAGYHEKRDFPGDHGTSRMSPHLHWGEISPRQIWHMAVDAHGHPSKTDVTEPYLREIGWREFSYHLIYHFPDLPTDPLNQKFADFPWRNDADDLKAWQYGNTGVPIIDAGMRELYETGWQHNRVRMITGSFLVKNLLLHWTEGERWFWDTLVDGDLASNSAGWQWIGGCGADAA
ncbi:MAG: deoxyribodipyrimidine photo-lyase, partial [Pseudomonadota bacterium]